MRSNHDHDTTLTCQMRACVRFPRARPDIHGLVARSSHPRRPSGVEPDPSLPLLIDPSLAINIGSRKYQPVGLATRNTLPPASRVPARRRVGARRARSRRHPSGGVWFAEGLDSVAGGTATWPSAQLTSGASCIHVSGCPFTRCHTGDVRVCRAASRGGEGPEHGYDCMQIYRVCAVFCSLLGWSGREETRGDRRRGWWPCGAYCLDDGDSEGSSLGGMRRNQRW